MGTIATTHPGAFAALQRRPVQGPRAAASFEVALEAFTRAGLAPEDAYSAVKAASLMSLAVALERGMAAQGVPSETAIEDLPPEAFPEIRRVAGVADPEAAWLFSLETLVSGLRAQVRRHRKR